MKITITDNKLCVESLEIRLEMRPVWFGRFIEVLRNADFEIKEIEPNETYSQTVKK